jgi:hypothetical protein
MGWFHTWAWILDIAWLCLLIALFWHFWRVRYVLQQAKSWLKANGHVTHCEWTQVGHSVWPKIKYSYTVNEQELLGEYLFLDTSHNNPNSQYARRVAYKVALAYKEQSEIDVFYNPNNPDQSALDVTVPQKLNVILLLICCLVVLHVSFIFFRILG